MVEILIIKKKGHPMQSRTQFNNMVIKISLFFYFIEKNEKGMSDF